jgi:hypothetical protein
MGWQYQGGSLFNTRGARVAHFNTKTARIIATEAILVAREAAQKIDEVFASGK